MYNKVLHSYTVDYDLAQIHRVTVGLKNDIRAETNRMSHTSRFYRFFKSRKKRM
jgi:hypothetical protein